MFIRKCICSTIPNLDLCFKIKFFLLNVFTGQKRFRLVEIIKISIVWKNSPSSMFWRFSSEYHKRLPKYLGTNFVECEYVINISAMKVSIQYMHIQ